MPVQVVLFGEIAMTAKFGFFRKLMSALKRWMTGSNEVKSHTHCGEGATAHDCGVFAI